MHTYLDSGVLKADRKIISVQPRKSYLFAKRLLDIFLSAFLLIILSPVFIITIILLYFSNTGGVIFLQKRLGLKGKLFTIYKFRTMKDLPGSPAYMYNQTNNHHNGNGFHEHYNPIHFACSHNDPRITPLGRILRKTSIDELPQLINVLKGDMSLVGPRPLIPGMMLQHEGFSRTRTLVKPGITGLFQIRDRVSKNNVNAMIVHDMEYLEKLNLLLDLKILIMTVPAVIKMNCAY